MKRSPPSSRGNMSSRNSGNREVNPDTNRVEYSLESINSPLTASPSRRRRSPTQKDAEACNLCNCDATRVTDEAGSTPSASLDFDYTGVIIKIENSDSANVKNILENSVPPLTRVESISIENSLDSKCASRNDQGSEYDARKLEYLKRCSEYNSHNSAHKKSNETSAGYILKPQSNCGAGRTNKISLVNNVTRSGSPSTSNEDDCPYQKMSPDNGLNNTIKISCSGSINHKDLYQYSEGGSDYPGQDAPVLFSLGSPQSVHRGRRRTVPIGNSWGTFEFSHGTGTGSGIRGSVNPNSRTIARPVTVVNYGSGPVSGRKSRGNTNSSSRTYDGFKNVFTDSKKSDSNRQLSRRRSESTRCQVECFDGSEHMERKRGRADDQCAGRDYSDEVDHQYALNNGINFRDESIQNAHIDSLYCADPSPRADYVSDYVDIDFGGGRGRAPRSRNDSGVKSDSRRRQSGGSAGRTRGGASLGRLTLDPGTEFGIRREASLISMREIKSPCSVSKALIPGDHWGVTGDIRGLKRSWEPVTTVVRDPGSGGQRVRGGKALFQDDDEGEEDQEGDQEEVVEELYSYHCNDFKGVCDCEEDLLPNLHCIYSGAANTVSDGDYSEWGTCTVGDMNTSRYPLDDLDVNVLQPKCSYEIEDEPDVLRLDSPQLKYSPSSRGPKHVYITNQCEGENENEIILSSADKHRLCSVRYADMDGLAKLRRLERMNQESMHKFHYELDSLKEFIELKGGSIPATLLKIYNKKNPRFLRLLETVLGCPVRQLSRIFENNVPWGIFVQPPTYVDDCLKSTLMFSIHPVSCTPSLPSSASASPSKRHRRSPKTTQSTQHDSHWRWRSPVTCPADRVVTKSNFKITFLTNRP